MPLQSILYSASSDIFTVNRLYHPSRRTLQYLLIALKIGTTFLDNPSHACVDWGLLGSLSLHLYHFPLLLLYFSSTCCPLFLEHSSHLLSHMHSLTPRILIPTTCSSAMLMKIGLRFLYYIVSLLLILSSIACITACNYSLVCVIIWLLYVFLIRQELLESRACGCFCSHLCSQFLTQWPSHPKLSVNAYWMDGGLWLGK